jgi:hypothetical protein
MALGEDTVRLAKGKNLATVVTLMPDGQPQALPTWVDTDGEYLLVNTEPTRQRAKWPGGAGGRQGPATSPRPGRQRRLSGTLNASHTARHTVFTSSPLASARSTVRPPRPAST